MALTVYDICSAALVMVGAEPIASFADGTTEAKACGLFYQPTVDNMLSLYPWRFATKTTQLSRDATGPGTKWQAAYLLPAEFKAVQAIMTDVNGNPIPFDRFENKVMCDAGETQAVWCVYTYDPPIAWWPGYFQAIVETALALRLSFAVAGKIDLRKELESTLETLMRYGRNADSRQQTTRKFRVDGRRSITEARRA